MFNPAAMDEASLAALKEKLSAFKANPEILTEQVEKYFDAFDKDSNGHLDRKELRCFMEAFFNDFGVRLPLTDEYVDATFRELDADRSNSIEMSELKNYAHTLMGNLADKFS